MTAEARAGGATPTDHELTDLEDFFENSVVAMHCVAADGVILRANRAELDLLGYKPDEYVGRPIADFHADRAVIADILARLSRGEKLVKFPARLRAKDGSIKNVLISSSAQFRDGKFINTRCVTLDVTAEDALRAREAQAQAIIDRTPFMLARCSRDLRYRFVSESWATMLGYRPEDTIGRRIVEIIGESAFNAALPHIEEVLKGNRVEFARELAYRGIGARFVHVVYMPERDERGEVTGWVASVLDLTEQKQAELERGLSEAALAKRAEEQAALYEFTNRLFRADSLAVVFDAALEAILSALHCSRASILRFDEHGVMRFAAWRGLSDRYRQAVEGHSPWSRDEVNPAPICIGDVARSDFPDDLKSVLAEEKIGALAFIPLVAADRLVGKFMAYYETPHVFDHDEIDLTLNIARQLGFAAERIEAEQARQVAERELRRLTEKLESEIERRTRERDRIWNVSEDLLGVSNFDGYFLSINPAWIKLLGWSEDEIKSLHVSKLRHPDDAPRSIAGRAQLAQGVPTVRMENRFGHKDGSWRWIQWTMTAENGLIYVSGRHVTLEKEAAAALERAQRQSAHSQKMEALGQLTGGVAHDFNNLLMIVSGHAQTLKRRLTDTKGLRALDAIQIASTRGESLTRQLLSFSRSQPLSPTVIGPADAVSAIREVLSGSLHVNIELSIDVPESTWPVRVDKSELELALVNLAVNARDAMPDGGRLSIFAENVELKPDDTQDDIAGDFVALRVTDTGCGIADDILARVFEPFFTTKSADKGTGLGLSQVYGFARRSGGTVVICSPEQRGTVVTIYLPRSHGRVARPVAEDESRMVAHGEETVLIVEDNHDVRTVAVSLLEQLGYRTIAVETAPEGLKVLESGQGLNLVFTDLVLPGDTDGLALARTVKDRYPDIPIVLTTGYAKVFDSDSEFPVLRKPYQISALGRVIREALDSAAPKASAGV